MVVEDADAEPGDVDLPNYEDLFQEDGDEDEGLEFPNGDVDESTTREPADHRVLENKGKEV